MNVKKTAFLSSLIVLGGIAIRSLLKAEVKLKTMAIRRNTLQDLYDEDIIALYFNPAYVNEPVIRRDRVALKAYKKTKDPQRKTMQPVPLIPTGDEIPFDNDKDYSVYLLRKEDIEAILNAFPQTSGVEYILFEPQLYNEDRNYFSYKLIPADNNKKPIELKTNVAVQQKAVAASAFETEEGTVISQMFAVTSTSVAGLSMDPSPPATSSFSLV